MVTDKNKNSLGYLLIYAEFIGCSIKRLNVYVNRFTRGKKKVINVVSEEKEISFLLS